MIVARPHDRFAVPHLLEQERPTPQIDDRRAFGPHRLGACCRRRSSGANGPPRPFDRFVDSVNDVSVGAMSRGRGAVTVRFWVDAQSLVATVSNRLDGVDRVVSVSPFPDDDPRYHRS